MFGMFKKEKFPVKTFILVSLFNFLLLLFVLSIFKALLLPKSQENTVNDNDLDNSYYLKDDYKDKDPLITSVPALKDMIRGPIISDSDPNLGDSDSKIIITEFADFECAYCKKQEQIIKELVNEYSGKIKLVWKDFPDIKITSPSYQASVAGRCAMEQGKFWEYHDLLFAQSKFSHDLFVKLANILGLDINAFTDCLGGDKAIENINNNIKEASALEINGVPFIYINDQEVMGEATKDELKKIIDKEIKKVN